MANSGSTCEYIHTCARFEIHGCLELLDRPVHLYIQKSDLKRQHGYNVYTHTVLDLHKNYST